MVQRFIFVIALFLGITCILVPASARCASIDSIYSLEKINIGGIKQTILITGKDSTKPLLLLLHGGPGFPELPLFRTYNKELDNNYIVVNWDQRGTGLSYNDSIPKESMNIGQFIADAHELISLLKKRFKKEKIFLAGHSWGSILGINLVQRYPQDFYAYIGMGQAVSMMENEKISLEFTLKMARESNNQNAIAELTPIAGRYPAKTLQTLKDLYIQRKWLSFYGGAVYGQKDYSKLFIGITAKEGDLYDEKKSAAAESFSMTNLWLELLNVDLIKTAPILHVPIYFLIGHHDYNTSYLLAEEYFGKIKAPLKKLIWFENSSHMVPFEEPEKFNRVMEKISHQVVL